MKTLMITATLGLAAAAAPAATPLPLQRPSMSATAIVFDYAGEIWGVPREGGMARRLVTGLGRLSGPVFSPDGSLIAYSGVYDDTLDVYVVAATGGEPRRLTYHLGGDVALGFTPDGTHVLFRSLRATSRDVAQLFTVPVTGGQTTPIWIADLADSRIVKVPRDGGSAV